MRSESVVAVALAAALAIAVPGCGTDERILGNVVDPQLLAAVTKFRSCCGHSFAVGESNRTMKHYLVPKPSFIGGDHALPVHAPCDGKITSISPEEHRLDCLGGAVRGDQVRIVCRARPDVSVRIFHVNPTRGPGSVDSGELLGYADLRACNPDGGSLYADIDVSVEKLASMYSYIEWLDDGAFAAWAARGLSSRDAAIVSKAERDANPCNYQDYLMCQADTITFP